jgi:hypothetical protein
MQADYVSDAVLSVIEQTVPPAEILVLTMDEKSNEKLRQLTNYLKLPPGYLRWFTSPKQYVPAARNYLINQSFGDYFIPLDADDYLERNFIEEVSKIDADIVYTDAQEFGISNKKLCIDRKASLEKLRYHNCIHCCSLVRRESFEKTGQYNETLIYGLEDYELWLNMYKHGYHAKHCESTFFWYRRKEYSMIMEVAKNPERIYQMVRNLHPDLREWGLLQLIKFKLNKYRVIIRSSGKLYNS